MACGVVLGRDPAGADAVDPDAVGRGLGGEGPGQALDPGLGGAV